MAPKVSQQCAKYQYVVTLDGPRIVPVPDTDLKDEESIAEYNSGGYLAIRLKDSFKDGRYVVLRKLGWGHFSTVWLVKDNDSNCHSALKVVKSAGRYAETARDEIRLLRKVQAANPSHPGREQIVSFLDSFQHVGPEESHVCIVFEPLGENLLALIERNKAKGVPRGLVRSITKQLLLGLQYLHEECDLVHTDIKPENIMISIPDVEAIIQAELSMSPSPTGRKVGVPPGKSRAGGVSIPKKIREKQVHIFDSQPLPSPTSRSRSSSLGSSSYGSRPGLAMSTITSAKPNASSPQSCTSVSTSMESSPEGSGVASPATPPTSLSSGFVTKSKEFLQGTELNEKKQQTPSTNNILITPRETPVLPKTGPSLLTLTAPRNLHSNSETASPQPAFDSDENGGERSSLTPTPPPPSPLPPPIRIKIADLGNATPSRNHFTEDIQTRQYRAPEAILGRSDWDHTADIWSVACVVFELLTAEYLFDPQSQGEVFSKDDDHMAQIIELLGDFPMDVKMHGKYSREIFDSAGALRYIKTLKPWPMQRVMVEKYLYTKEDSKALCDFLLPMLRVDFHQRAQASDMLDHPWLVIRDEEMDEICL